jgi:hypothetical protein
MKNKKFKDLVNNRVVNVTDQFEDIVILDGKSKIKFNQLMNPKLFEEVIDPGSFLQNETFISTFVNQLKSIPLDDFKNRIPAEEMGFNESFNMNPVEEDVTLPYDPEVEKEKILKKYQNLYKKNSPNTETEKQWDSIKDLIDNGDETSEYPKKSFEENVPQQPPKEIIKQEIKTQITMDPILEMFKNVKRNTNFKIEFTVENKIPRIDFIEMMEDSYNTSIIDFLSQEFTDEIVKDPSKIKDKIKSKLMDLVYPPDEIDKNKVKND